MDQIYKKKWQTCRCAFIATFLALVFVLLANFDYHKKNNDLVDICAEKNQEIETKKEEIADLKAQILAKDEELAELNKTK